MKTLLFLLFWGAGFAETLIITSASGELGSAAARLLAADYDLILTGRNISKLEQLQEELRSNHPWNYEICTLDYSSSASIANFREGLKGSVSGIVLIPPRPPFHGKGLIQEESVWLDVFQSSFTGPLEVLKAALPHLGEGSRIVAIVGTTSVQYQSDSGPTSVIRRMWTTYTKALSHQLGPQGIRVNALSPGIVLTHFHEERIERQAQEKGISYEEQMARETMSIPLRRHAQSDEVAKAIRFLLSEESSFVNGANLVLDGGFTVIY